MPLSTSCYIHGHPPYNTLDAISPELQWSGAPANTQSYVIVMIDDDIPATFGARWLIRNIPAAVQSIPAGVPQQALPWPAAIQIPYQGNCPPHGVTRHYTITIFALDEPRLRGGGGMMTSILRAVNGHVLARGYLVGTFTAP